MYVPSPGNLCSSWKIINVSYVLTLWLVALGAETQQSWIYRRADPLSAGQRTLFREYVQIGFFFFFWQLNLGSYLDVQKIGFCCFVLTLQQTYCKIILLKMLILFGFLFLFLGMFVLNMTDWVSLQRFISLFSSYVHMEDY